VFPEEDFIIDYKFSYNIEYMSLSIYVMGYLSEDLGALVQAKTRWKVVGTLFMSH